MTDYTIAEVRKRRRARDAKYAVKRKARRRRIVAEMKEMLTAEDSRRRQLNQTDIDFNGQVALISETAIRSRIECLGLKYCRF